MLTISPMKEADIDFAIHLTELEKWAYIKEDFRRLIYFEPKGCFVARKGKEKIGIVTTTTYKDYAFLGSLIVKKEERGRGIGNKLMCHAIDYLEKKGTNTIELDGVFPAVSLYRRLGFKDKYLSLRLNRKGGGYNDSSSRYDYKTLDEILSFDREKTGISRERILMRVLKEFSSSTFLIIDKKVVAYAVLRPRADGSFTIGPLIAENTQSAEILLTSIISKYPEVRLNVGIPEINHLAVEIFRRNNFIHTQASLRMYRGKRKDYERHIYGILSPEKG